MSEVALQHLHEDLLDLKREVNVIRHILSEEGKLTKWAKKALEEARSEHEEKYTNLDEL